MDSGVKVGFNYNYNNMSCRTTGGFTKRRSEGGDGRSSTTEECDSTTEPLNPKVQFEIDEDVYYQEDTGQNVLGTVGLIQGKKIKIIFMDGTQKWAPLSRVKKISLNFSQDEEEVKPELKYVQPNSPSCVSNTSESSGSVVGGVSSGSVVGTGSGGSGKKKIKSDNALVGYAAPKENCQVTCGSCGTQKMIAPKKAMEFSPYTTHQYNCRKCINKSKTNKNNGVPIIAAHYLAAARGRPRGPDTNGAMTPAKGILEHGIANGVFRPESDRICLHCRSPILEKVSLHCTMCERPCHPSCLTLTPPPLPGDTFWSIICHVCGTQKHDGSPENDSQKVYSSRRSITCWSDVALLLLSCLGCKHPTERFFHLDEQVIPFWEENLTRLHLPRQYKTAEPVERRRCLLLALKNAHLRFVKDETRDLWGILEKADLNMVIKPPMVSNRGVTAAGFPISVRASNPEAASVAMSNIAQTIAVQAAANKANNVPTPKNSPSNMRNSNSLALNSSSSSSSRKSAGQPGDHHSIPKKAGTELNPQRAKQTNNDNVWGGGSQSRFGKATELLPKSQFQNHRMQPQQQQQLPINSHKHNVILSPTSGGAARVTGMVITTSSTSVSSPSTSASGQDGTSRMVNCGSYPVRKNGSPILNKSIRVEPLEKRRDGEGMTSKNYFQNESEERKNEVNRDIVPTSSGISNHIAHRLSLKRKMSVTKPNDGSSAQQHSEESIAAKRLKIGLPSSTDVTSKRLPSPPKSVDSSTESTSKLGQKKALSPLQKLSDLQKNGGLTVACLKHTDSGYQTVTITPTKLDESLEGRNGSVVRTSSSSTSVSNSIVDELIGLPTEEKSSIYSTPTKNSQGAPGQSDHSEVKSSSSRVDERRDNNTKDKASNVTTTPSPRAFKLASVSTPGSSKTTSPILSMERRIRSTRIQKRAVVDKNETEKQTKPMTKKLTTKVQDKAAAALNAAVKTSRSRGRPKGLKYIRNPNNRIIGYHGQFNGRAISDDSKDNKEKENSIDETEFSWVGSKIEDLLEYGQGYRLECLPKYPEGSDSKEEVAQAALKHLKEELAPRPPSYWSSSSYPQGKKPINQKSRRDLKDPDSYYVCGKRLDQNGIQYQVVWRDGYGFEYSSEDEEELGVEFGENYIFFEEYDPAQYFRDKMPLRASVNGDCDNNGASRCASSSYENGDSSSGGDGVISETNGTSGKTVGGRNSNTARIDLGVPKVKSEPTDQDKVKSKGKGNNGNGTVRVQTQSVQASSDNSTKSSGRSDEDDEPLPMIIDLTDSP